MSAENPSREDFEVNKNESAPEIDSNLDNPSSVENPSEPETASSNLEAKPGDQSNSMKAESQDSVIEETTADEESIEKVGVENSEEETLPNAEIREEENPETESETEEKHENAEVENAPILDEADSNSSSETESETESENEEEAEEEIEEDEHEDSQENSPKDYSSLSENELISELKGLLESRPVNEIKNEVEEIRTEFNAKISEDFENKKALFLSEGGNIIDFRFASNSKKEFNTIYTDFKNKRNSHFKKLKNDLQANLAKRWELIEELKGLLNAEENINTTSKHFKTIQEQWRAAGPIPRDKYNTVWNTYHHHVENFYDFLNLNRDFRDLDFKHNLEEKLKIIIRAEALAEEQDINKAFRELQLLHKMWKEEIGPVAKEYRDEVWDKFSEATKIIHDRRQIQLQDLEKVFEDNYTIKINLIDEIKGLASTPKPSHQAWQNALKAMQKLRDTYFQTGPVSRNNNKQIWKAFKDATAEFNHEKNNFYKTQKKEQFTNLEKKQELIKTADENKDGEDFEMITPLMKKIQNEWKLIGHVPRKDSDRVWKQFKTACNHYFDRVHAQKTEESQEELSNFEAKKTVLESLANLEFTGDHKADVSQLKTKINAWKELGRVPQSKRHIEQKFNKTLDSLFGKLDLGKKETELIKFENKLNSMVTQEDERKLQNEHFFISKKIDETRDEILQLENNLGFFQHVDSKNPLVREVHKNIANQKEQLEVWKAKLKKIKLVRED